MANRVFAISHSPVTFSATFVRHCEEEVFVLLSAQCLKSIKPFAPAPQSQCVFEHVYFARPDSYVFGESVNEVRTNLGRRLAREAPVDADVIVPVPDSGVCAAIGFSEESGVPMRMGLIRHHYVRRTVPRPPPPLAPLRGPGKPTPPPGH